MSVKPSMAIDSTSLRPSQPGSRTSCTDPLVGAVLSGWRYDISGNSPDLRLDYDAHLRTCGQCRHRQRIHRTVDVLLLAATSLSFAAFLLAALVMHRLEVISHITTVHLPLHPDHVAALSRIPDSITVSLEAVAIAGVIVSMLLWILVAIATPIAGIAIGVVRDRISTERLRKQAA